MINNSINSLEMLKSFFENDLSTLDLSDLITIDTSSTNSWWNSLIFNEASSKITSLNLKNLEQSPYIITLPNLTEVCLDNLKYVEFDGWVSKNVGYDYSNFSTNIQPRLLQNTKLKKLILPNFVGSPSPTCKNANAIEDNSILPYTAFINNKWLQEVSLGNQKMFAEDNINRYYFNGYWFNNNYFLKSLELNYPYVIPIMKPEFFLNNPIKNGSGYIFVPNQTIADAYAEATGWNTLQDKIKPISQKPSLMPVEIEDSWETIVNNCKVNTVSQYHLGDVKMVMINNIATPYVLVGKNQDAIHSSYTGSYDGNTARLTWMEATISRFSPENINQNEFSNNAIYNNAVNIHAILNSLYNTIISENPGLDILPVYKRSKGYNPTTHNLEPNVLTTDPEYLWIPSAIEVNAPTSTLTDNTYIYSYFLNRNLNYCFGYTNINKDDRGNYIEVALRDYSAIDRTSPDVLQATASSPNSMTVISSSSAKTSYIITGFCT